MVRRAGHKEGTRLSPSLPNLGCIWCWVSVWTGTLVSGFQRHSQPSPFPAASVHADLRRPGHWWDPREPRAALASVVADPDSEPAAGNLRGPRPQRPGCCFVGPYEEVMLVVMTTRKCILYLLLVLPKFNSTGGSPSSGSCMQLL